MRWRVIDIFASFGKEKKATCFVFFNVLFSFVEFLDYSFFFISPEEKEMIRYTYDLVEMKMRSCFNVCGQKEKKRNSLELSLASMSFLGVTFRFQSVNRCIFSRVELSFSTSLTFVSLFAILVRSCKERRMMRMNERRAWRE